LSDPSTGFNDTEERSGSIKIGKAVVLNEFLPKPIGPDTALKPGGEWVEHLAVETVSHLDITQKEVLKNLFLLQQ
jgi:hypothetical protein